MDQGPYRLIRHPFYTSYLLAWTAGYFASGSAWSILTVVAMVVLYKRAADLEERKFEVSKLRNSYAQYRQEVGQFVPRLRAFGYYSNNRRER